MKVLIIDNQYTQFEQLKSRIEELDSEHEFDVYPKDERGFISLLTSVKVFIHYNDSNSDELESSEDSKNKEYRKRAWTLILTNVKNADIILMDYRLGSPLTSMTGLKLSEEIWKEKDIPILILSRDEQSREGILVDWTKVKSENEARIDWLVKGYWGTKLLPSSFVSANIIPTIKRLQNSFIESGNRNTLIRQLQMELERLTSYKWADNKQLSLLKQLLTIIKNKSQTGYAELKLIYDDLPKDTTTHLNTKLERRINEYLKTYYDEKSPSFFAES